MGTDIFVVVFLVIAGIATVYLTIKAQKTNDKEQENKNNEN